MVNLLVNALEILVHMSNLADEDIPNGILSLAKIYNLKSLLLCNS